MMPDPTRVDLTTATDEDLVRLLRAGEADVALRGFQERYGRRLFHFVHGMVRDQHLAQDIVQEVFEKVLLKNEFYQQGTNFRAWLFEIARNQALSVLRTQRRLPRPVSSLQHDLGEPGDLFDAIPFRDAVEALPEHYQTVFDLCVRQGKPYQEAGQLLGLPTGTVAIRIMRARKRLFAALERHLGRLRRPPACFQ